MIPVSYNIRSLAQRKATTFATALGIALVVFVFSSVLMLGNGIERTLGKSGSDDVAMALRKGSDAELSSSIEINNVGLITSNEFIKRRPDGTPDAVGEVLGVLALDKLGTDGVSNVQIRGITDDAWAFRPNVHIVAGRKNRPGADEVVIGKSIRGRFKGLEIGQKFDVRKNRPVEVVGVLEDNGSSTESEVWGDIDTVRAAFGRVGLVSSVRARLRSTNDFDGFKTAVETNRQLGVAVMRESKYYEKQSSGTAIFIKAMGLVVAIFFSIGAMIGAMITMYSTVANRSREIGTLRALGFSRTQVLTSFLFEGVILAVGGGLIGALGSLAMSFVHFSIMNFASWSEISFSFDPNPKIIFSSLFFAAAMGLLGSFFPAFRASRTSVLAALRG